MLLGLWRLLGLLLLLLLRWQLPHFGQHLLLLMKLLLLLLGL